MFAVGFGQPGLAHGALRMAVYNAVLNLSRIAPRSSEGSSLSKVTERP